MAEISPYAMSPEELRDLAARKEAARYFPEPSVPDHPGGFRAVGAPRLQPWERDIEVDGHAYRVDMRPLKSREFLRRAVEIKEGGLDKTQSAQFELMDFVLEPVSDEIERVVSSEMGYVDAERYYEIASRLFEEMQAKN